MNKIIKDKIRQLKPSATLAINEESNKLEKKQLENFFKKNTRSEEEFSNVLKLISKYKIISQCYRKAEHFINLAKNSLTIFRETKEKKILENLTSFSLERSF